MDYNANLKCKTCGDKTFKMPWKPKQCKHEKCSEYRCTEIIRVTVKELKLPDGWEKIAYNCPPIPRAESLCLKKEEEIVEKAMMQTREQVNAILAEKGIENTAGNEQKRKKPRQE